MQNRESEIEMRGASFAEIGERWTFALHPRLFRSTVGVSFRVMRNGQISGAPTTDFDFRTAGVNPLRR